MGVYVLMLVTAGTCGDPRPSLSSHGEEVPTLPSLQGPRGGGCPGTTSRTRLFSERRLLPVLGQDWSSAHCKKAGIYIFIKETAEQKRFAKISTRKLGCFRQP